MSESPEKISIYLIDDQTMIRAAFRSLIQQVERFVVVGDSGDAREAIAELKDLKPDLVILDITMPGLSGLDAIEPIKRVTPKTNEAYSFVHQALQCGADGYLSKDSEPEELKLAIDSIYRGDSYLSPKVAGALVNRVAGAGNVGVGPTSVLGVLTPREREVFQLIALGKANKEIAAMLNLSLGTIKKHRENLQRKLDCHSAAEIARLAIREGLLSV